MYTYTTVLKVDAGVLEGEPPTASTVLEEEPYVGAVELGAGELH
jgi:hypothetical protein